MRGGDGGRGEITCTNFIETSENHCRTGYKEEITWG